jgi:hypothetical protein
MTTDATFVTLHINSGYHGRVGSLGIPIFPHAAAPADQANLYTGVEYTTDGVICGHCNDDCNDLPHRDGKPIIARHASSAHVRACQAITIAYEDDVAAEAPLVRAGWL